MVLVPIANRFNNNTSFNIFELDAASNNSVDDIRSLDRGQVRFAPQQGKYKVYIIDEVHMLSTAAFNAFLKTLEEPPSYAIFILATTEKHKILPTILSRCQIFDFKRITTSDTVAHLEKITTKESINAEEAALHVIAQKSEGCMRDALSILDRISSFTNGHLTYASTMEHLNQLDADFYFKITDHILSSDVASTLLLLDEVLDRGFEGDMILDGFSEHFRNLLLCKDARMTKLLDVPNNHKPIYHEKAGQCPPSFILSALNVVNQSVLEYKNANNRRLHTELCLIRMCYLLQATRSDIEGEKKNTNSINPTKNQRETVTKTIISTPPSTSVSPTTEQASKSILVEESEPGYIANERLDQSSNLPFAQASVNNQVRRISRNTTMTNKIETQSEQTMLMSELSLGLIQEIFDEFSAQLKADNKSILFNAFQLVTLSMPEEGTLQLTSPNNITDSYVQTEKSKLQELLKQKTGLLVRITNSFIESDTEPKEKVLTKAEIFNEMASKNPMLLQLKESLKMGLDY